MGSVLFDGDTGLNHYQVIDTIYNGRPARVLYSGNKIAAQSGIAFDDKPELLFDYNERFMELVRGTLPGNLLLIGGGAFTFPTAAHKEFPKLSMDVVELDSGLADIAKEYFSLQPDQNLRVHILDGLVFIAKANQKYDLVIVDVFENAAMPPAFQTPEAIQALKQRTASKGVLALNVIGALKGDRSQVLRRLAGLLQSEFSEVMIFPAEHGLSPWMVQNFVITAQNGIADLAPCLRYLPVEYEP